MIQRDILPHILHWVGKEKILILKGARQVGKTTLLRQIMEVIRTNSGTDASVVYLSADDVGDSAYLQTPETLEEYLRRNHGFPDRFAYVFIDEFQTLPDAGRFLKNLFDTNKARLQLIVSGSSSLEITKNTEFLTGRSLDFDIMRISFREFFRYENTTEVEQLALSRFGELSRFWETYANDIRRLLPQYLAFGGYPEVITTKDNADKQTILASIAKTYIEKDVAGFLRIENISGFNTLIRILADQIGNLVNVSELCATAGLARATTERYLEVLNGTYVFSNVTPFYRNTRAELTKMPKAYMLDPGMRNYFLRTFEAQHETDGHLLENFVYLELLRQFKKDHVHFYRTISGAEIDFVVETPGHTVMPIEVKFRRKTPLPVAMRNFRDRYPDLVLRNVILTKNTLRQDGDTFFLPVALLPFTQVVA